MAVEVVHKYIEPGNDSFLHIDPTYANEVNFWVQPYNENVIQTDPERFNICEYCENHKFIVE